MSDNTILEVRNLKKHFPIHQGVFRRVAGHVEAVGDVSFSIKAGECVGLVGESGCGKTTAGRCIIRLLDPTAGEVLFTPNDKTVDMATLDKHGLKEMRQEMQFIFQDPFASLDPRMTVGRIIAEPMKLQGIGTHAERMKRVRELLEKVGLSAGYAGRFPHEFSGGQRQRIGIARSLSLNPRLVICDEPVSALDVSVQAQVLNVLKDLQNDFHLTYLFVAHDLSVVEYISDRIMVMYLGRIVEIAGSDELYESPKHPYTEALLKAIPIADPKLGSRRVALEGSVPDAANPPAGCYFNTRCPYATERCRTERPELRYVQGTEGRMTACHYAEELELTGFRERASTAYDL